MTPVVATQRRLVWPLLLCAAVLLLRPPALRAQDDDPLAEEDADEGAAESDETPVDDEQSPASEPETDDAEVPSVAPSESDEAAEPPAGILFHVGAGLGAGTLSFSRPTATGRADLDADAVRGGGPADAPARMARGQRFARTAARLPDLARAGGTARSAVRAARTTSTFAPSASSSPRRRRFTWATGRPQRSWLFPLGFVFRAFVPEVDYLLVSEYSLGGPEVRAELWLHLGEYVTLRLGPELQWIVVVDDALRREDVTGSGLALGGQGTLEGKIGPVFRVALAYRESHTTVPGTRSNFRDTERFFTVRVAGEM